MTYPSSIVFIGDSITANMSLGRYLPQAVNKGVPGDTTAMMLNRFYADVVQHSPQAVVILGGTNNIIGSTVPPSAEDLASMVQAARASNIKPLLCTIPPMVYVAPDRTVKDSEVRAFNALVAALATTQGIPLADYYTCLTLPGGALNPPMVSQVPTSVPPMRVHPTDAGYDAMFEVLSPLLEAL